MKISQLTNRYKSQAANPMCDDESVANPIAGFCGWRTVPAMLRDKPHCDLQLKVRAYAVCFPMATAGEAGSLAKVTSGGMASCRNKRVIEFLKCRLPLMAHCTSHVVKQTALRPAAESTS